MDGEYYDQLMLIAIPVLSAAAAFAISWLRAKTREFDRKHQEEINKCFQELDKTINQEINEISKISPESIADGTNSGILSNDDIEKIKLEVLRHVYETLGESHILILKKATDDLDYFICSKIDAMICRRETCEIDDDSDE